MSTRAPWWSSLHPAIIVIVAWVVCIAIGLALGVLLLP